MSTDSPKQDFLPAQPFPWFDDSLIEREHDKLVANNTELGDHLQLFHHCFDLLHALLRNHSYEGRDDALAVLRLAARLFNASGACLKVARAGYFQPAFAIVRDILEVEFLADAFLRDSKKLEQWMTADARTRSKEFKQVKIREFLDQQDGFKERNRGKAYALLSTHAAHANPDGFHVISPGGMTQIGPFVSEERLLALFQELAKHLQMACMHLTWLLNPTDEKVLLAVRVLDQTIARWRSQYIPITSNHVSD